MLFRERLLMAMAEHAAEVEASAFWIFGPGQGALRSESLKAQSKNDVLVETIASGVSRGTETLVFKGLVPKSQHDRMRAPFQVGDFSFPVKYGYASVGRVIAGGGELKGQRVFCLHPHQDRFVVPADAVIPVPPNVASGRAVLAANMETALNGLWDAPPRIGDRISVIGCGVVGALSACLAAGHPGVHVEVIDTNPRKAAIARALGLTFVAPDEATPDADLVIHASGRPEGLRTAFEIAGFEATILDLSWYGDREVALPLGENFHSRRLKLISSQVGSIAPAMRLRKSHRDRLELALTLLADQRYDVLLSPPRHFSQLPSILAELSEGRDDVMCQPIVYRQTST
ncbi:MAG: zinc-binding alcohol dehydrogenase [Pseudomonadota bacterium]